MTQVIACIDGIGERAEAVCDTASWASRTLNAPMQLIHVLDKREYPTEPASLSGAIGLGARESLLDELSSLDEQRGKLAREQGRLMLQAALERAQKDQAVTPTTCQRHSDLISTLEEMQPETRLLVLGKGEHGDLLGGHLEPAIRALHRPILVTDRALRSPKKFLLAYDGSACSRKALDMVATSPLLKSATCELIYIGPATFDIRKEMDEAQNTLQTQGFQVNTQVLAGEPEEIILQQAMATGAELLVMGAYGHSRIRQLLVGSTTSTILRRCAIPLLLLR